MVDVSEARNRRLFFVLFAVAWICALVPLWAPRFLPLLDLPRHLAAIAIWHRHHDPSWGYSKFYELNLLPVPYWGYFFPVHLLGYLFPLEIANKIYLSIYALMLPLSVAALAVRMGRSRWLALFSFPLVFNMNLSYGFIGFCAGVVLLNFAIVALDAFLEAPTRRRAVAVALLALALYLTHVLPWMFFGVASLLLLFCHGWHPRRALAALALELPSLLLALVGFHAAAGGNTAVQAGALGYQAAGEPLLHRLQQAPVRLIAGWGDNGAYWMLLVLGLAWALLLLGARSQHSDGGGKRHDSDAGDGDRAPVSGFAYRLELLSLAALVAYLALPLHLVKPVDLWMIGGRFMVVVALWGALLPVGELTGARRWILIPVVAISISYPIFLAAHWVRYDQRAASFRRLLRDVPRGSSTLVLVLSEPGDPDADAAGAPFTHYHAYAQYLAGGYDPWALSTGFPFTLKRDAALAAPHWLHARDFNFDAHGIHYDYILTKGETAPHEIFGPDDAGRAPLAGSDGDFRLYQVRR